MHNVKERSELCSIFRTFVMRISEAGDFVHPVRITKSPTPLVLAPTTMLIEDSLSGFITSDRTLQSGPSSLNTKHVHAPLRSYLTARVSLPLHQTFRTSPVLQRPAPTSNQADT